MEPKCKKPKASPKKTKSTESSFWLEDPRVYTDLPEQQQSPSVPEYHRHWDQMRTRYSRQKRLLDWYSYRISFIHPSQLMDHLNDIFLDQNTVFKLNVSFGFILRNNETSALQYYYASRNNNHLFDSPFQIATEADLEQLCQALCDTDILEWVRQQRPNSNWVVDQVTNVTFFITKLRGHPIGRGKHLPHYIVENRGIVPLDRDKSANKSYDNSLCFFRALVLHNGCHIKNLERHTQHYYERYRQTQKQKKTFHGVTLEESPDLERLFEVKVFVYSLEPTKPDGDDGDSDDYDEDEANPEVSAQLI